jgi:PAS domain S-box-containing protein
MTIAAEKYGIEASPGKHPANFMKNEQAPTRWHNLELLIQFGLQLATRQDLKTLVQSVTDTGLQLCGAQFGAFFYHTVDSSGESYRFYTSSGVDPVEFAGFSIPSNAAVFAPSLKNAVIIRSDDITEDPRYGKSAPYFGVPGGHMPARSYLAVPVKSPTGEVLGGLFYGHPETGIFSQEAEDLIATIASQAAGAIENHRLREQLTGQIEDLEKAEREEYIASRHRAELAAIVESSDDPIISKDLNGNIKSWNQAASRVFGYAPDEIIGRSILLLIPPELQSEETTILQKIRSGERIEHYETVRLAKGGARIEVSLSISPLRDKNGTIVGASKILRDISMRKRIEASLLQAEKIAATGRMAATIAHEVNNPLEAVMNLIYLARTNAGDAESVRSYLRAAESEIVRVSHIAKQTLGFYRENASPVSTSLSDLVDDAIRIYQSKCDAARISITRRHNSTRRVLVRRGEMMQVISNLLANSIYAMPQGGRLTLSVEDSPDRSGLTLVIEDTGIGIPADQLPRIFEAFFTSRSNIGTGIGLFIARQFVEGYGGSITVASSIDPASHGTRMTIFLPAE